MRGEITKRAVVLLAIVSGLSLLALAFLQYRWITQLGASERALLDASIERGTRNFREEFDIEISSLIERTMRGQQRNPEAFATRFRVALASIRHPQIIRAVLISSNANLLEATATQFKAVEWPMYLHPLLQQMQDAESNGPPPRPFWNENPPAIGLPGQREPRSGPPEDSNGQPPPPGGGESFVIFEFDASYIKNKFIPELITKHFGEGYQVDVVSVDTGRAVMGTPVSRPDAEVGFFQLHVERPRERRGGPPRHEPPQPPKFDTPRWLLRVKHEAGSLDQQVAGARHRNLAITFTVLLMMGLSSTALVVWLKRAEQLNRMQMDFVAGVSHELRTPLSVIRTAGENLADGVVSNEKQIRKYGALVRDEGKRLSTMVEQILRFAGTDSGRALYTFTPVSVASLIDRALEGSVDLLAGVEVEKQLEGGLPKVMADEPSLSHCLQNLLGNAVKYGDGKWVKVEALHKGDEVEFAVTDRGPGIDPSEKPNVFNAFFRGKKAMDDQIHGLGIGLSLVKRVAEAHGGRADVQNLTHGGARFSVFIPVERGEST